MLKAALPNETRHPRSLPPTIDLKDLIACKVWSSADYKPIAQREKVMPPTPRLSRPDSHYLSYKATGPPPTGVDTPQTQERKKEKRKVCGSHEGSLMARPVPAIWGAQGKWKDYSRGVWTAELEPESEKETLKQWEFMIRKHVDFTVKLKYVFQQWQPKFLVLSTRYTYMYMI